MADQVARVLDELDALDRAELRARWIGEFGHLPQKQISRDLLLRALAYRVQEKAEGGLSKAALKHLGQRADHKRDGSRPPRSQTPRLKPGTRLVREWRGEAHQVTVLDDGFDYRRTRYASLSRIAREITGTRWSGPLFFGLRKAGTQKEASTDDR